LAIVRHRQHPARAWLGAVVVLLLGALGSCGGTSISHRRDGTAGVAVAAAGTSGAETNGAGTSGGGADQAGKGGVGPGGAGIGGAAQGGEAGDATVAGAGGAPLDGCVDVCELYGQACCTSSVRCVSADASCVVQVFDTRAMINYEYVALEELVASLPPLFLASVSTADIVSSAAEPSPTSRIELHLSAQASSAYGTALEGADLHPFRVSCAGQSLFVGQVYQPQGAAALKTPVLHVLRDADDAIVLRLGAWQGAWAFAGATGDIAARERIDRSELRSTLCLAGALQPL
jgi:hypothetical protein